MVKCYGRKDIKMLKCYGRKDIKDIKFTTAKLSS